MNDGQRATMHGLMRMLVQRQAQIHYRQSRPMDITGWSLDHLNYEMQHGGQMWADCSEMATALFHWVGAHDPNGMNFDGYGNSSSMWSHLPKFYMPSTAKIGTLVTFGQGGYEHVAVVYNPGPDPILFSHGSERGPDFISLSGAKPYLPSPATMLAVGDL